MNVLIFEPGEGGHRLQYIRSMLPAIVPLAHVTIGLREDVPAMDDYKMILGDLSEFGDRVKVDASIPVGHPFKFSTQWNRVGALKRLTRTSQADRIYIPSADGLAQVMGVSRLMGRRGFPRRVTCEAMILRGGFAYAGDASWKQRAKVNATWRLGAMASFTRIHLLDPIVYERVLRDAPASAERYRLMPEPVETPRPIDRISARRALGIPEEGRYVGCAGFIDLRKGIDLFLRAFRDGLNAPTDRLLLAGPQGPGVGELLAGEFAPLVRAGRIIAINRLFESREVGEILQALDLVVTPYRRHVGSASILIRAAAAGRPVLAANFGWMEMVVRRFGLGTTCDVFNPEEFARELKAAIDAAPEFSLSEPAKRFVEYHTVENFAAHWADALRTQQGLLPLKALRTWQWVANGFAAAATAQTVSSHNPT